VQNVTIPCCSQELLPFLFFIYPFPSTLYHQLVFHPPSLHLAIYFLVCLSASLFPNSYVIFFWEFYFLLFSVYSQTNIIILYDYKFILIASPCDLKHTVHNRCLVCVRFSILPAVLLTIQVSLDIMLYCWINIFLWIEG